MPNLQRPCASVKRRWGDGRRECNCSRARWICCCGFISTRRRYGRRVFWPQCQRRRFPRPEVKPGEALMDQILVNFISTGFGAIAGGCVSYYITTRATRNQARRDALSKAVQGLQDYRVAYAQWYVEYLSPQAEEARGHWAKPPAGTPDKVHLDLMGTVDRGRGSLRTVDALLVALFPEKVISPVCTGIMDVLHMSGQQQSDCREVDRVADATCDLIPDLIRKYSR
jgi:hypothetical protein